MGGGSQSLAWMQILADITNKRIEVVEHPQEAGAVGAACVAAVGMGIYPSFDTLKSVVRSANVLLPRREYRETYNELFEQFKRVYSRLRPVYDQLNRPER